MRLTHLPERFHYYHLAWFQVRGLLFKPDTVGPEAPTCSPRARWRGREGERHRAQFSFHCEAQFLSYGKSLNAPQKKKKAKEHKRSGAEAFARMTKQRREVTPRLRTGLVQTTPLANNYHVALPFSFLTCPSPYLVLISPLLASLSSNSDVASP
jgi:hypothetical protein